MDISIVQFTVIVANSSEYFIYLSRQIVASTSLLSFASSSVEQASIIVI